MVTVLMVPMPQPAADRPAADLEPSDQPLAEPVSVAQASWEHQVQQAWQQVLAVTAVPDRHAAASASEVSLAVAVAAADSLVAVAPEADQQVLQDVQVMIKELVAVAPEAHLIQVAYWEER